MRNENVLLFKSNIVNIYTYKHIINEIRSLHYAYLLDLYNIEADRQFLLLCYGDLMVHTTHD